MVGDWRRVLGYALLPGSGFGAANARVARDNRDAKMENFMEMVTWWANNVRKFVLAYKA